MKYISINHPEFGMVLVQFSPHVPHHKFLEALGNPACIGAGFVIVPETITPRPIGYSQSLGKSPAMPDAKLLEQGYRVTRLDHESNTLFSKP